MRIDLQLHSIYSDGYLTPAQLAHFIKKEKIKVASLTDHNTLAGQIEFQKACRKERIKVVPGLELYVRVGSRKINILWYNYQVDSPELYKLLLETQKRRRQIMRQKLERLKKIGFHLNVEKILSHYPEYVPVNKVADEFFAVPYNRRKIKQDLGIKQPREEDLFIHYFFNKNLGVLRDARISLERVLKLRQKIGGQIIFCHPGHFNKLRGNIVEKLKKMGVDGLELLSPHHSHESVMYIQYLAQQFDFVTTGGSDLHKFEGPDKKIRHPWQWFEIDSRNLRKVEKIIGR